MNIKYVKKKRQVQIKKNINKEKKIIDEKKTMSEQNDGRKERNVKNRWEKIMDYQKKREKNLRKKCFTYV